MPCGVPVIDFGCLNCRLGDTFGRLVHIHTNRPSDPITQYSTVKYKYKYRVIFYAYTSLAPTPISPSVSWSVSPYTPPLLDFHSVGVSGPFVDHGMLHTYFLKGMTMTFIMVSFGGVLARLMLKLMGFSLILAFDAVRDDSPPLFLY